MSNINPVLLSKKPPELGLVCITTSDAVRFRTVTRKRLLQLTEIEQEKVLRELYADNLLYRMTSALFPFADIDLGETVLDSMNEELRRVGDRAIDLNIRLVFHPDQFVVLSSDKPDVVKNSIKILATHALIMDMLQQPRSPWALMNIHGGKGDRTLQLKSVIRDLPESIRSRLTFENDEYAYSSSELLDVCLDTGVAMVFDAHHHVIHEHLESYNDPNVAEMLAAARTSWPVPEWQLVHISNGKEFFADPRHSDLIVDMPNCYYDAPWIEVEAK
ncbi:MAG: UV damage endonuclease UvsE, partial [Oscillatoriales cyanobacterium]